MGRWWRRCKEQLGGQLAETPRDEVVEARARGHAALADVGEALVGCSRRFVEFELGDELAGGGWVKGYSRQLEHKWAVGGGDKKWPLMAQRATKGEGRERERATKVREPENTLC